MRQQREVTQSENGKFDGLTDELILTLGKELDNKALLHVETVYFSQDGGVCYNTHPFKSNGKTKQYRMISVVPEEILVNGRPVVKNVKKGKPEDEIVFEIDAADLVEKYFKLKNKNKK